MIAVIFEVTIAEDKTDTYLALAAMLKPELTKVEGFISVERYQSLADTGKLLSLSFWQDEDSVQRWRNSLIHRKAQAEGRRNVFTDYRLRIAGVVRDYGMFDRHQAPGDSQEIHGQGE